jgi:hypothetical protein
MIGLGKCYQKRRGLEHPFSCASCHLSCSRPSSAFCRVLRQKVKKNSVLSQLSSYSSVMSTDKSTDWSFIFFDTLNEYLQPYIDAYDYPTVRAKILNDCEKEITKSPLHDKQVIGLPENFCWVCVLFLSFMCV